MKREVPLWARLKGMDADAYDAEMLSRGGNYFDSRGDWIELDPVKHNSPAKETAIGVVLLVAIVGGAVFAAITEAAMVYVIGRMFGWWP